MKDKIIQVLMLPLKGTYMLLMFVIAIITAVLLTPLIIYLKFTRR